MGEKKQKKEGILRKLKKLMEEEPERYKRLMKLIEASEEMGGYLSGKEKPSSWRSKA